MRYIRSRPPNTKIICKRRLNEARAQRANSPPFVSCVLLFDGGLVLGDIHVDSGSYLLVEERAALGTKGRRSHEDSGVVPNEGHVVPAAVNTRVSGERGCDLIRQQCGVAIAQRRDSPTLEMFYRRHLSEAGN